MKKISLALLVLILFVTACGKKESAKDTSTQLDPAKVLQEGNRLYSEGMTEDAFRTYKVIYDRFPTSREYISAAIGLSRCYNDLGNYEKGFDVLLSLLKENLIPSRVPEIYNEIGRYFEVNAGISSMAGISDESKDYENAIQYYQKSIDYPNSDDSTAKAHAQLRIAELDLKLGKLKDAVLAFKATEYNFPGTVSAQMATQRLQEFREAVNTVLSETKTGAGGIPDSVTSVPKEEPAVPNLPDTTVAPPPPDTSAAPAVPDTSLQTSEMDTTMKPELDLK